MLDKRHAFGVRTVVIMSRYKTELTGKTKVNVDIGPPTTHSFIYMQIATLLTKTIAQPFKVLLLKMCT